MSLSDQRRLASLDPSWRTAVGVEAAGDQQPHKKQQEARRGSHDRPVSLGTNKTRSDLWKRGSVSGLIRIRPGSFSTIAMRETTPELQPKTCADLCVCKSISGLSRVQPGGGERNALTSGFVNQSLRDLRNLFLIRAQSISRRF